MVPDEETTMRRFETTQHSSFPLVAWITSPASRVNSVKKRKCVSRWLVRIVVPTETGNTFDLTGPGPKARTAILAVQYDQINFRGRDDQARDGLESTAVSCQERLVEHDVLVWLC
jgi:hypothetical protein